MPDSLETTFNQYAVIISRIGDLDKKIDKIDNQMETALHDHEQRLRVLESRLALFVSLGIIVIVVAVSIAYLLALLTRGAP